MSMMATMLARGRSSFVRPTHQSAHFDVAVKYAEGPGENSGGVIDAMDLLAKGLEFRSSRSMLTGLSVGGLGIARDHGHSDRMSCVASKLHCFDDRLFEMEGGADFVRAHVPTARHAGRITGPACTSLPAVFFNRQRIFESFGGYFDFVVGEPAAVLSLFGLKRIDTLIPRLSFGGTGLALHRVDHPPLLLRPGTGGVEAGKSPISREAFWSEFVPSAFEAFLEPIPA